MRYYVMEMSLTGPNKQVKSFKSEREALSFIHKHKNHNYYLSSSDQDIKRLNQKLVA